MSGRDRATEPKRDPGAFIGHEPELAADRIPGGVRPEDDRVAFNASERAGNGEPGTDTPGDPPALDEAGQNR